MAPSKSKVVNFDKMFAASLIPLMVIGSHPSIPRNKSWFLKFILMHGIFTIVFCLFMYNMHLCLSLENYSEACRNGTLAVVYCVISFKYFILISKQNTITRLMDMMKVDYARDMTEDARAIVFSYAMQGRKVTLQWLTIFYCVSAVFICKHIFLELYTYVMDDWKLLEIYPLTYPSPVEENKEHPVVFALLYLITLYYNTYAGFMYLGFVPLGPVFMVHACGQLEIVKKKALALYRGNSTREVDVQLAVIVKQLQYIFVFVECINKAFSLLYEFTLKATAIILPITLYEVLGTIQRGESNIEFISIIVGAVFISGHPCYYSDKLMEKGEEVRLAIYSCGWETRYDHGVRKTLLVTVLRTLRPIAIRTLFRAVCLDALTDLYQQAYALFNLMNAAWG